jgi:hypothetical protein
MLDKFAEIAPQRTILTKQSSVKIKSEALADGADRCSHCH